MKNNHKGFAVLQIILLLVVVGIIGGTGWYVWHSSSQANKNLDNATNASDSAPPIKTKKISASSIPQKYLDIKEWGVKIPLSADDTNAYYTYDSTASLGVTLYDGVSIFDSSFDQLKNSKGISCKDPGYPLFAISRAKTGDVKKLLDYNDPNFIGDTGPANFAAVSFTKDYQFAGTSSHQARPNCEGSDTSSKAVADIESSLTKIQAALKASYSSMQAE
jgi:hypothetical protein